MTQETEMPNEIWAGSNRVWWGNEPNTGMVTVEPYIRRAVSKEEAGEVLEDMPEKGSAEMEHHFAIRLKSWYAKNKPTIRKMAEAHK